VLSGKPLLLEAGEVKAEVFFFLIFVLLFICAYKAWFISPPCPHPHGRS
jgi:hypothetical protein